MIKVKLPRVPKIKAPPAFQRNIGRAIGAYADVEGSLAFLLKEILKVSPIKAFVVFEAASRNSRARNIMFGELLNLEFNGKLSAQWNECDSFLGTLAKFRNAIAHWHPHLDVWQAEDQSFRVSHSIAKLVPGGNEPVRLTDIKMFVKDCDFIKSQIDSLTTTVAAGPSALPDKYQPPTIRPNLAALRQRQMPKAPQPQRPPSVPKLSKAQKRARALKAAREKMRS